MAASLPTNHSRDASLWTNHSRAASNSTNHGRAARSDRDRAAKWPQVGCPEEES